MFADFFGGIINDHNPDIIKFGTGGLDRLPIRTFRHHIMGMAVEDHINSFCMLIHITGTMPVPFGLFIHAKMCQRNDNICLLFFQLFDFLICAIV